MGSAAPESSSYIWFLRTTSLFEDQTESLYHSVERQAKMVDFERGEALALTEEQDTIFVIVSGEVKLRTLTEGGKEIIIDIAGEGDAIGPLHRLVPGAPAQLAGGGPGTFATEAVALSKGGALKFDLDRFREMVERRPLVAINLSRILGLRQHRLQIRLTRLLYRSSLGKVAGLLCELAERYGTTLPDGRREISVRLTHQEIASIIGTKRETVSECLAELELRELILARRGGIVVCDPQGLDHIQ